jgi:hypothetical protein
MRIDAIGRIGRIVILAAASLSRVSVLVAQIAPAPRPAQAIVGVWRGESACVNRQLAPACTDEQVQYIVTAPTAQPDTVHLNAQKRVEGTYETMYEIELAFDTATHEWRYDFETARCQCRWTYSLRGTVLVGAVIERRNGGRMRAVRATRYRTSAK